MGSLLKRNLSGHGRLALVLMAVALLGLLAIQGCTPSAQVLGVGNPAPDFTLVDLDGNQVSLSDFRGKTVFINFWATWCLPCRREMPAIEAVYQEYKDRDVVVIGMDVFEPEGVVRQYVQEGGYSWTFVIDTTGEVTASYKVTAIPTSFFIDGEGIIRAVNIGEMNKGAMEIRLRMAMEPKVE